MNNERIPATQLARAAGLRIEKEQEQQLEYHLRDLHEHFERVRLLSMSPCDELPALDVKDSFSAFYISHADRNGLLKLFNGIHRGYISVPRML
ncbi:MAG: hypothetical protein U5N86_12335 [Planctomycetota bacterium]|nr:hypothetical protein [Planctomycetota bacterium]